MRQFHSHGTGKFKRSQFRHLGINVIFEPDVLVFHPENIEIGNNVYIGHGTILKGYYQNTLLIGNDVWIGQNCFLHSGGGIVIENDVGIGPHVKILTLTHKDLPHQQPIIEAVQEAALVSIKRGCDIGIGAIILPGVTVGEFTQIGAGSVVTKNIPAHVVAVGVPARVLRERKKVKD